ncbi:DUF4333 domain-containing protein [Mycobacterium simiae]|uniref:DUF4333 domain-containing protein n=1 Tax=Mycobacterium simiae TaxID=1784 RepID=A0A5B1BME5_MYCSI|nr:DUF4333 domain-containing protein [Mycobacterium simiae]KAA1248563.1 DUF4333 domain-containing protein [Mycobacterium simiae]
MSGPQGPDPRQQWQPPGQGGDRSSDPTVAGSPWQQQPTQEATWQTPAYTPAEYPQYPQQYPPSTPGYGQPDFGSQATQYGAPPQYGQPGQYGPQYGQPGQYGQPAQPGQYGQPAQYPGQFSPYDQSSKGSKRSMALIGGVVGVIAVLFISVVLALGFWQPGFFVTTKLDVNKANAGVQQILTDETNGYGAKNVKDVKCNNGANPTVKKGATFDCTVSIDGAPKRVTVTFQDSKGTYEVGRPQ